MGTQDRKHWDNGKCGLYVNCCGERETTNPLRLHLHLSFYFCAATVCRCVLLWLDDCTLRCSLCLCSCFFFSFSLFFLHRHAFIPESWLCYEFMLTPLNDQREAWGWDESAKTYLQKLIWAQIIYLSINIQLNADEGLHCGVTLNVEIISCCRSICECAVCLQRAGSWTTASH